MSKKRPNYLNVKRGNQFAFEILIQLLKYRIERGDPVDDIRLLFNPLLKTLNHNNFLTIENYQDLELERSNALESLLNNYTGLGSEFIGRFELNSFRVKLNNAINQYMKPVNELYAAIMESPEFDYLIELQDMYVQNDEILDNDHYGTAPYEAYKRYLNENTVAKLSKLYHCVFESFKGSSEISSESQLMTLTGVISFQFNLINAKFFDERRFIDIEEFIRNYIRAAVDKLIKEEILAPNYFENSWTSIK